MRPSLLIMLAALTLTGACTKEQPPPPPKFDEALDLIHAHDGAGDGLDRAMQIAYSLSESHPDTGFSQTLHAELISTWQIDQDAQPKMVRVAALNLANAALELNPKLAQAHVAKARVLVRSSLYPDALVAIDSALAIQSDHAGALFQRAEVFRRTRNFDEAAIWYHKFIAAAPSLQRQANGYAWLGRMYQDATYREPGQRSTWIAKGREAYENGLKLRPNGAWGNVKFAIFLNDHAADFDNAEKYAQKALDEMEFKMARYHLAAARFQRLGATESNRATLKNGEQEIAESTGVSLKDAIAFSSYSSVVRERLRDLQLKSDGEN